MPVLPSIPCYLVCRELHDRHLQRKTRVVSTLLESFVSYYIYTHEMKYMSLVGNCDTNLTGWSFFLKYASMWINVVWSSEP